MTTKAEQLKALRERGQGGIRKEPVIRKLRGEIAVVLVRAPKRKKLKRKR